MEIFFVWKRCRRFLWWLEINYIDSVRNCLLNQIGWKRRRTTIVGANHLAFGAFSFDGRCTINVLGLFCNIEFAASALLFLRCWRWIWLLWFSSLGSTFVRLEHCWLSLFFWFGQWWSSLFAFGFAHLGWRLGLYFVGCLLLDRRRWLTQRLLLGFYFLLPLFLDFSGFLLLHRLRFILFWLLSWRLNYCTGWYNGDRLFVAFFCRFAAHNRGYSPLKLLFLHLLDFIRYWGLLYLILWVHRGFIKSLVLFDKFFSFILYFWRLTGVARFLYRIRNVLRVQWCFLLLLWK